MDAEFERQVAGLASRDINPWEKWIQKKSRTVRDPSHSEITSQSSGALADEFEQIKIVAKQEESLKNVIKQIKSYNDNLLEGSLGETDKSVQILTDPKKKDISPLLVHLDQLRKVGIDMPNEHLLRLD
jgi:hypothetical protein